MLAESKCAPRSDVRTPPRVPLSGTRFWWTSGITQGSDPIQQVIPEGCAQPAAPTEISRPRTFSGQPQSPSWGLCADQPSGMTLWVRKLAASSAHLV